MPKISSKLEKFLKRLAEGLIVGLGIAIVILFFEQLKDAEKELDEARVALVKEKEITLRFREVIEEIEAVMATSTIKIQQLEQKIETLNASASTPSQPPLSLQTAETEQKDKDINDKTSSSTSSRVAPRLPETLPFLLQENLSPNLPEALPWIQLNDALQNLDTIIEKE